MILFINFTKKSKITPITITKKPNQKYTHDFKIQHDLLLRQLLNVINKYFYNIDIFITFKIQISLPFIIQSFL